MSVNWKPRTTSCTTTSRPVDGGPHGETIEFASVLCGLELTLDGTTIRGSGSFLEGGEMTTEPVEGEIVANC